MDKKPTILIVGLNHQIQRADILSAGDDIVDLEAKQKDRFAAWLQTLAEQHKVNIVAEEALHGYQSIAQIISTKLGCKYINVEMPPRDRAHIPSDYSAKSARYTAGQVRLWHDERERFMVETVRAAAAGNSVLLICGRSHVQALSSRFADAGYSVSTADVNEQPWYVEDWLEYVLHGGR